MTLGKLIPVPMTPNRKPGGQTSRNQNGNLCSASDPGRNQSRSVPVSDRELRSRSRTPRNDASSEVQQQSKRTVQFQPSVNGSVNKEGWPVITAAPKGKRRTSRQPKESVPNREPRTPPSGTAFDHNHNSVPTDHIIPVVDQTGKMIGDAQLHCRGASMDTEPWEPAPSTSASMASRHNGIVRVHADQMDETVTVQSPTSGKGITEFAEPGPGPASSTSSAGLTFDYNDNTTTMDENRTARIAQILLSYRHSDTSEEFARGAIEHLVKKLKQKGNPGLRALFESVTKNGKGLTTETSCVTLPRTVTGKVVVMRKKEFPHVIYARIWRSPDVCEKDLTAMECCQHAFALNSKEKLVCVNPYHYVIHGNEISSCEHMSSAPTPTLSPQRSQSEPITEHELTMRLGDADTYPFRERVSHKEPMSARGASWESVVHISATATDAQQSVDSTEASHSGFQMREISPTDASAAVAVVRDERVPSEPPKIPTNPTVNTSGLMRSSRKRPESSVAGAGEEVGTRRNRCPKTSNFTNSPEAGESRSESPTMPLTEALSDMSGNMVSISSHGALMQQRPGSLVSKIPVDLFSLEEAKSKKKAEIRNPTQPTENISSQPQADVSHQDKSYPNAARADFDPTDFRMREISPADASAALRVIRDQAGMVEIPADQTANRSGPRRSGRKRQAEPPSIDNRRKRNKRRKKLVSDDTHTGEDRLEPSSTPVAELQSNVNENSDLNNDIASQCFEQSPVSVDSTISVSLFSLLEVAGTEKEAQIQDSKQPDGNISSLPQVGVSGDEHFPNAEIESGENDESATSGEESSVQVLLGFEQKTREDEQKVQEKGQETQGKEGQMVQREQEIAEKDRVLPAMEWGSATSEATTGPDLDVAKMNGSVGGGQGCISMLDKLTKSEDHAKGSPSPAEDPDELTKEGGPVTPVPTSGSAPSTSGRTPAVARSSGPGAHGGDRISGSTNRLGLTSGSTSTNSTGATSRSSSTNRSSSNTGAWFELVLRHLHQVPSAINSNIVQNAVSLEFLKLASNPPNRIIKRPNPKCLDPAIQAARTAHFAALASDLAARHTAGSGDHPDVFTLVLLSQEFHEHLRKHSDLIQILFLNYLVHGTLSMDSGYARRLAAYAVGFVRSKKTEQHCLSLLMNDGRMRNEQWKNP